MTDCIEFQEMLSAGLDGELTAEESVALSAHMAECDECRSLYEIYRQLSDELTLPEAELPETLIPGVMSRIAEAEKKSKRRRLSMLAGAVACVAIVALGAPKLMSQKNADKTEAIAMAMEAPAFAAGNEGAAAEEAAEEDYKLELADAGSGADCDMAASFAYVEASSEAAGTGMIANPDAWQDDPQLSVYHDKVLLYGPITEDILKLGALEAGKTAEGQEQYELSADKADRLLTLLEASGAYCWFSGNPEGNDMLILAEP